MSIKKNTLIAAIGAATLASATLGTPAAADPGLDANATRATMLDLVRQAADTEPQGLVAAVTGSAVHAAPWQVCASATVAGVGGVVDTEPDVILGNCRNANVKLWQDTTQPGLANALSDAAILAAPWQVCGADTVAGVGGVVSVQASKTVMGNCDNANVDINITPDGYGESADAASIVPVARQSAPRKLRTDGRTGNRAPQLAAISHLGRAGDDNEAQGLVSAGSGSAIIAAPWQVCGSAAVAGVGGTIPVQTPHTMNGDCNNANTRIRQSDPTAVVSVLDNSVVTAAAWQVCGSDAVAGVGGVITVGSPNIAMGDCNNANTVID